MCFTTHDAYKNKNKEKTHDTFLNIFHWPSNGPQSTKPAWICQVWVLLQKVSCFTYTANRKASALDSICLKFTHERLHMWFSFFFPPPPSYPEQNQNKHHFYIHIFVQTSPFTNPHLILILFPGPLHTRHIPTWTVYATEGKTTSWILDHQLQRPAFSQ